MKIFNRILLFAAITLICLATRAIANSSPNPSTGYQSGSQQSAISEQAAVVIAQKQIEGRVLAIRLENNVYRIKILSNQSTVHIVAVSAASGKIIPSQ